MNKFVLVRNVKESTPEAHVVAIKWYDTEGGARRGMRTANKKAGFGVRLSRTGVNNQEREWCTPDNGGHNDMAPYGVMTEEAFVNRPRPMKKVVNLLSGKEVEIAVDTPRCCDPSQELYWTM